MSRRRADAIRRRVDVLQPIDDRSPRATRRATRPAVAADGRRRRTSQRRGGARVSSNCRCSTAPPASRPIGRCGASSTATRSCSGRGSSGRRVYLPVTQPPRTMTFARWREGDRFVTSSFGIDEPLPTARRVALAPARCRVDAARRVRPQRHSPRPWRGLLRRHVRIPPAAAAHRVRCSSGWPTHSKRSTTSTPQEWDVPLDFVVTEQRTLRVRP